MPKLKLSSVPDEKPIRMTVTFTAAQAAELDAYARAVAAEQGRELAAARLIPLIVEQFIATDRAFARARATSAGGSAPAPPHGTTP